MHFLALNNVSLELLLRNIRQLWQTTNRKKSVAQKRLFFLSVCEHDWHLNNISISLQQSILLFFYIIIIIIIVKINIISSITRQQDRLYSVYSQKKIRLQWTNIAEKSFQILVPSQPAMLHILMISNVRLHVICITENDGWKSIQLLLCSLINLIKKKFFFFIRNCLRNKISLENCSWRSLFEGYLYSD